MPATSRPFIRRYLADAVMLFNVIVWGVQFIVMKDAISTLPPLAYNAIRFSVGLPLLLMIGFRNRQAMRIARADIPRLIVLGLIGQFGYQVLTVLALDRTTGTNVSLLLATVPSWTAILSILLGTLLIRRAMLLGLGMSLVGVALVILGDAASPVSVSHGDVFGMGLALTAALCIAIFTITIKPLMDRYGASVIAIWTYILTCVGLLVVASPDLLTLGPGDIPPRIWPHIAYSGILSSAIGFLLEGYAIRHLGAARMSNYYNVQPLVTAIAGVLVLHEPITRPLVLGGALALVGVTIVRRTTLLRPATHDQSSEPHTVATDQRPLEIANSSDCL